MLITSLPDADGSRCTLTLEEPERWLRATWRGFIDPEEAFRGADNYLKQLDTIRCPYLLNDNTALHGPWFDSLDWLLRIWVPQAARMGLRYVAHVVQQDAGHDTISNSPRNPAACLFELQIFDQVSEAEEWLRACQAQVALTQQAGR
ncbi:MAG: hypothetical protein EOO36_02010 [Cytophagaceae bacterium]|nr:MAG: hypothetical protein EOO36_02010 [Cytophagaceae bacterium]